MQAGSELSDRLGRAPVLDEPRPRDGYVRRRWAGKGTEPELTAQALRMGKSGRLESQDEREMTVMEKPTLARRDLGEVRPESVVPSPPTSA